MRITASSRYLAPGLIALLLALAAAAQQPRAKSESRRAPAGPPAEAPILHGGTRYESGDRPDPFLNPLLFRKTAENMDEEEPRGQPPPGIAGMYIAQVTLLGTALRDGAKTAIFRGPDQRAYFLQENDKLFDGYVKQIESDSVLLIRQAKLRSGRITTQEVTKRLRTP